MSMKNIRRVRPGERLQITAADWNTIADAVQRVASLSNAPPQRTERDDQPSSIIIAENGTGSNLDKNTIVSLTGTIFSPSGVGEHAFVREANPMLSTDMDAAVFAVLVDAIPDGQTGRVMVAGGTPCKLYKPEDETYRYCRPYTTAAFEAVTLAEVDPGTHVFPVIYHEEGDGTVHATIVLPGFVARGAASASECSPCNVFAGDLTAEVEETLLAAPRYDAKLFCNLPAFEFLWDVDDWSPAVIDWDCGAGEEELTATLATVGDAPGDVTITLTDGTHTWMWTNETAWQPQTPLTLTLQSGVTEEECPCAPVAGEVCLIPRESE